MGTVVRTLRAVSVAPLGLRGIKTNITSAMTEATPKSYYKCWTAYDSLFEAAVITSHRSVWECLKCNCCSTPHCWLAQPLLDLPENYVARIRWYDSILIPEVPCAGLDPENLRNLQRQFVGHHQRIELVLMYLNPSLDKIQSLLRPYAKNLHDIPDVLAEKILAECAFSANGWHAVAELVRGVCQLDRIHYLQYAPRLAGVSGGNSPLMMPLTTKTANLENMFSVLSTDEVAREIRNRTNAGRIAEAFIDCLDALSRCWFDHVVTATTPIGLTCGTKGTPNSILVESVIKRLHRSRLLEALGSLRSPILGIGIEMRQLYDYSNYPLADHYLDLFVDPGPEFGSHSLGWSPKMYEVARQEFSEIRRRKHSSMWEFFYSETRPAFCECLRDLMGLDGSQSVEFGLGSSVTDVLWRLLNSIQTNGCHHMSVVLPNDEFVTLQRAAGVLCQAGAKIIRCAWNDVSKVCRNESDGEENKESNTVRKVVFVSLVNSCTQRVQTLDWVHHLAQDTLVVIDITQAVANLPLRKYQIAELAVLPNVFFVGSLIKHARCGEGLGFLSFRAPDSIVKQPASGWTAFLSGLQANATLDQHSNALLYDTGLQWEGGTPAWIESAYVATRILKCLPSVEAQHDYVTAIKTEFLARVKHILSKNQAAAAAGSESNAISLPVSHVPRQKLMYGLDFKVLHGQTYLRIGFGIQNLDYHLDAVVKYLEESNLLD